ncbi:hypothetical protein CTAYLR_000742 [Chrysophaeum taylorii]|uniref:Asparagine synthetase domain-containing protein n=1 Tax=Chrysophaeum taylorii TaxID=2483200 RepID=A0AAD7UPW3_9STRA|nr:hypothetical protein CTAYLR_000742 [Chrysophaeum taylorii]
MCGIVVLVWPRPTAPDAAGRRAAVLQAARGAIERRGPDGIDAVAPAAEPVALCASVLRMRRGEGWRQPASDEASGCVLCWNGEWYATDEGAPAPASCDTRSVLALLVSVVEGCRDAFDARANVASALAAAVRGPYAFAFWIPRVRTVVYGRDPFGRRSLLRGGKTCSECFGIASVTPSSAGSSSDWEEVSTRGLAAVRVGEDGSVEALPEVPWPREPLLDAVGWPDDEGLELERKRLTSSAREFAATARDSNDDDDESHRGAADRMLAVLSEAVRRRVVEATSLAVLFSGGIDSAVLAALCDTHLDAERPIELVNVAFGARGRVDADVTPDRLAARRTLRELRALSPARDWRLVEVVVDAATLGRSASHVLSLASPSDTHMDFNIAAVLRHAAQGVGVLFKEEDDDIGRRPGGGLLRYATAESPREDHLRADDQQCVSVYARTPKKPARRCANVAHPRCARRQCGNCCRREGGGGDCGAHPRRRTGDEKRAIAAIDAARLALRENNNTAAAADEEPTLDDRGLIMVDGSSYACESRLLVLGTGADELLAGYARHRTAWRRGGRDALRAEISYDLSRIARRNLGRDDRVISDAGKEARFPFLDEDVVALARIGLDLGVVADLDLPPGIGCKRVLRDVARRLGLVECAALQKRAIQFGTRIAAHSNRLAFGSNRRADGASTFSHHHLVGQTVEPPVEPVIAAA